MHDGRVDGVRGGALITRLHAEVGCNNQPGVPDNASVAVYAHSL
jgi:hypothetical protein